MKRFNQIDCVEFEKTGEICGVHAFMKHTEQSLTQLIEFREEATMKLQKIEHLEIALSDVATHAKSMDTTLKELDKTIKETARDLIGVATGKKQVPISIFMLVTFAVVAILLIDKLANNRAEVNLSPTEFSYKPQKYEQPSK